MFVELRSRLWLLSLTALVACGATSRAPGADTGAEADGGSLTQQGGGGAASGGNAGSVGLSLGGVVGVGETETGGELSLGGAADPGAYDGPVDLCLYPEEIPDDWGAGGAMQENGRSCAIGVLGRFAFNRCRYELLSAMPFDVDPFVGGHSHCCYRSRLIGCP
jgi:hypothetical protein